MKKINVSLSKPSEVYVIYKPPSMMTPNTLPHLIDLGEKIEKRTKISSMSWYFILASISICLRNINQMNNLNPPCCITDTALPSPFSAQLDLNQLRYPSNPCNILRCEC